MLWSWQGNSTGHHWKSPQAFLWLNPRSMPRPLPTPSLLLLSLTPTGSLVCFPSFLCWLWRQVHKVKTRPGYWTPWEYRMIASGSTTTGAQWTFLQPWYPPEGAKEVLVYSSPHVIFQKVTLSEPLVAIQFIIHIEAVLNIKRDTNNPYAGKET